MRTVRGCCAEAGGAVSTAIATAHASLPGLAPRADDPDAARREGAQSRAVHYMNRAEMIRAALQAAAAVAVRGADAAWLADVKARAEAITRERAAAAAAGAATASSSSGGNTAAGVASGVAALAVTA